MDYTSEELQEYEYLSKRIEKDHSALYFFKFCELHRKIHGKTHPLCYYKALLVSISIGEKLTEREELYLIHLYKKYGQVNIDHILMCRSDDDWGNPKGINIELKSIFNDIIELGKKNDDHALAEHALLSRNNVDFAHNNKDNKLIYDSRASDELHQIFTHFKGDEFDLSETFTVKLTPQVLIHIITGHLPKFKIPRKGLLVNFPNITEWNEVIYLLICILDQEKGAIILSFDEKNRYDNKSILYNGMQYGLHIQKNKCISSFYPIPDYNV